MRPDSKSLFRWQHMAMLVPVAVCCLPVCAEVKNKTLTALIWEGTLSDEVIETWHNQTGWTVEQVVFDNDDERDRILEDDRNQAIDLVVVSSPAGDDFGKRELLQPIDWDKIPNRQYLDANWRNACGEYSIPYSWGTLGIVYRADKVAAPVGWNVLIAPEPAVAGHVGMVKDVTDTFAPVLAMLGHNLNTADAQALQGAYTLLSKQRPSVLTYQYAYSWLSQHPQDETLWLAMGYSGDHHALNELTHSDHWRYAVPREGTYLWVDCIGITKETAHASEALSFLNLINEPQLAAINAEAVGMATANAAAIALAPESYRNDAELFPSPEILTHSTTYEVLDPRSLQLRERILQSLMRQHESQ